MRKVCKRCNYELDIKHFGTTKNTKDGYENKCKDCRKAQRKEHHIYKCKRCGERFSATKKQDFCSNECSGENRRNSSENFRRSFETELHDYELLAEYTTSFAKVSIKHGVCGTTFSATPNNIMSKNSRCPACFGNNIKKDTEAFKNEVAECVSDEYFVLGNYVTNKTKIKMIHNVCGNEYDVAPDKFLRGRRCPNCKSSHGELSIRDYLDKNGIEYKREYRFEDCRHARVLPFDFAIFHGSELELLIEFDGEQHFIEKDFYGGSDYLNGIKTRDAIKDEYCSKKGIQLLRIPYYKIDIIDDILSENISKLRLS